MRLICIGFTILVLAGTVAGEDKGMEMRILALSEGATGAAIDVAVVIENKSEKEYRILHRFSPDDYKIEGTVIEGDRKDATSRKLRETEYLKAFREENIGFSAGFQSIKPGQKVIYLLRLSELYDMTLPGKYSFVITHKDVEVEKGPPMVLRAEITVNVSANVLDEHSPEYIRAKELLAAEEKAAKK